MITILHDKTSGKSYDSLKAFSDSYPSDYPNAFALWGTQNVPKIKELEHRSQDYYFIDMPYFDKLRSHFNEPGKEYWRICKNKLQINEFSDFDDLRFKQFNLDVYDWNEKGEHIVILPSNYLVELYYNELNWTNRVLNELKRYTDRKIIIRKKGNSKSLIHKKPLYEDIKDAHAVITLTSIAGIEAARLGIPVFCHEKSAAAPIGLQNLSRIECPIYPDRTKWLNTLSYSVFTIEEIKAGLWRY